MAFICACVVAALSAVGCAAPVRFETSADPLAVLGRGSMVYARLSGAAARELTPMALSAAQAKALGPVLARTRIVALGIGSLPAVGGTEAPAFQACLIGDYPFRAAALSLGTDPAWKREKTGFFNAGLGLRASVPGPGIVLASTGKLEPLLVSVKNPGPSPIPASLAELSSRELVLWVPEPFSGLVAAFLGEAMDLPVRGFLISASPIAPTAGATASVHDYDATIVFLMKDADSARIYRPALRLAWYGIAHFLFGDEAESALTAAFALDGDMYRASGVRLSGAALARALGALREVLRD
jgi:hypothetical protein